MPEPIEALRQKYSDQERWRGVNWILSQEEKPETPETPPEPKPEQIKGWFEDFAKTTAADVSNVVMKGVTLGIFSAEDILILGKIVTQNKTPDERKSALRKWGEFGTEMAIGAAPKWTWKAVSKLGQAAVNYLVPSAGSVVRGAVKGAAEMGAIAGTQATTLEAKEAAGWAGTPEEQQEGLVQRAGQVAARTLFGGALGGVFGAGVGRLESYLADRATKKAAEKIAQEQAAWEAAHKEWVGQAWPEGGMPMPGVTKALPPKGGTVPTEPIEVGPIPTPRKPIAALPPAPEPPPTILARDLMKKADQLEAQKERLGERGRASLQARVDELRREATERAAVEIGEDVAVGLKDPEVLARVQDAIAEGRIVLPKGKVISDLGPEGSVNIALVAALSRAAFGAAIGGYSGDTPEERVQNALVGAGLGAVLSPALMRRVGTKILDHLESRFAVARTEVIKPQPTIAGRPITGARQIRIERPATEDEARFIIEGDPSGKIPDHLFVVNLREWEKNPDRVKEIYRKLAEVYGTGKRPPRTDVDLIADARKLVESGSIIETMLGLRRGQTLNDTEMMGAAILLKSAEDQLIPKIDRFANGGEWTSELGNLFGVVAAITKNLKGASGEIGAALRTAQFVNKTVIDPQTANLVDLGEVFGGPDAMRFVQGTSAKTLRDSIKDIRQRAMAEDPASWPKRAWEFTRNLGNGLGEAYVMNLLSGAKTQAVNLSGDVIGLGLDIGQRGIAEKFAPGKLPGVVEGETAQYLQGVAQAASAWVRVISESAKRNYPTMLARGGVGAAYGAYTGDTWDEKLEAALTYGGLFATSGLAKGIRPFGTSPQWVEDSMSRFTSEKLLGPVGLNPAAWYGKGLDYLGEIIRIPGDNMRVADNLFRMMGYYGELGALTWREATRRTRLTGRDFDKILEELRRTPTDEIVAAAKKWGARSVYANDLSDVSKFAAGVQGMITSHPVLRLLVPIFRTPVNLFVRGMELTPGINFITKEHRRMWQEGGASRQLVEAELALGTMLIVPAIIAAYNGYLTGKRPRGMEAIYEAKRIPEYAVGPPGHRIPIAQLDPVAWPLMAVADYVQYAGQVSPEHREDFAWAILLSFSGMFRNKMYTRNFADMIEAWNDDTGGLMAKYVERWSAGLAPSLGAEMARITDPYRHHLQSARDRFMSRVPGQSKDVPYAYDIIGQPIPIPAGFGPDTVSFVYDWQEKNHPVLNALKENQTPNIRPVRAFVKGKDPEAFPMRDPEDPSLGVPLEPKEWEYWAYHSGKKFEKEALTTISRPSWNTLTSGPYGGKSKALQQDLARARKEAFEDTMNHFPRLKIEVEKWERRREDLQYGTRPQVTGTSTTLGPGLTVR